MTALRVIADDLVFAEAPRWHDGRLWFSDMLDEQVMSVTQDGDLEQIVAVPGRPSGLGWDARGRLLIVSMQQRLLYRYEDNDILTVAADLSDLSDYPFNDMVVDALGRAYIGNMGYHPFTKERLRPSFIAMVEPSGAATVVATDIKLPNGMAITADGATLLVAETFAHRLLAYDIHDDGRLGAPRVFSDLGSGGADGICLDQEGGVWVALPIDQALVRLGLDGVVTHRVPMPGWIPVSCALGGEQYSTLFICTCRAFKKTGMMSLKEALAERPARIEALDVRSSALSRWKT